MSAPRSADARAGFSLVELLVASTIFFAFMVGMLTIYSRGHRTYTRGQNMIEVQQSARVALASMTRELRLAGYDPSDAVAAQTNAAAVQDARTDRVTFIGDTNGDGISDRVTYRLVGDRVLRDVAVWSGAGFDAPESGEVAEGVDGLYFQYADGGATGNIAAPVASGDLDKIRRVAIEIVTRHEAIGQHERFPLVTDVTLRNAI